MRKNIPAVIDSITAFYISDWHSATGSQQEDVLTLCTDGRPLHILLTTDVTHAEMYKLLNRRSILWLRWNYRRNMFRSFTEWIISLNVDLNVGNSCIMAIKFKNIIINMNQLFISLKLASCCCLYV